MSRHQFGGSVADFVVAPGDAVTGGFQTVLKPSTDVTFWSASSGGTQITDLLDSLATPVTSITTDATGGLPQFQGPDTTPDTWVMWADASGGAGPRRQIGATDLGTTLAGIIFDRDWETALQTLFAGGAVGQYIGKDPDPASTLGIRWGTPASGGGGGGTGSTIWVDASTGAYAADKTGTTDARTAIQAAIDDVATNGGGTVYLPAGVYKIGHTSNAASTGAAGGLQMKSRVWLRGEGKATRLEATGTWSTQAGIVSIGDRSTTRPVADVHVSDLWIKGTSGESYAGTPPANIHGILFNTASISGEPDAVHRLTNLMIWDVEVGIALLGSDDQAVRVSTIRGRHFARQGVLIGKEDGSGGGPDNLFSDLDISSANIGGGTYAGIEIYSSNNHFTRCKSWYNKRATAFTAGPTYKDGSGWYVNATRNMFVSCEAQDNGGYGYLIRLGKNTFGACVADSSNYFDNISGSAAAHECSGFYAGSGISELTLNGCLAFDRNSTNKYQKYGFVIDAASRNVFVSGVAWDNRSTGSSADPLDGVAWINGAAHSTHEVKVLSAYGSSRTTISNGSTATGGAGTVAKRQDSGGGATVYTGTTLQAVTALTAQIPGGTRWYELRALIIYRADSTNNARIAVATSVVSGAGTTVDCHWQPTFTAPAGTVSSPYELSQTTTTRYVVVDGDGSVSSSGFTNQRVCAITGRVFVGSTVTTGQVQIQVCEDGGTGTGVRVIENSDLQLIPMTYT